MNMAEETYELIGISFEVPYEIPEYTQECFAREDDNPEDHQEIPLIEYDADGIPMGRSKVEIKMREKAIKEFYVRWISENPEKKVWNKALSNYILVKYISINETYEKAARSYESTKAIFRLTDILENALLINEKPSKKNNKNQKSFSKILIMGYERIKLTVGFQKNTSENVQYCITVPQK